MEQQQKGEKLSPEKREIFNAIEQSMHELNNIGHDIWRFCETGGQEHKSCRRIMAFLKKKGFHFPGKFSEFDTAFRAEFGDGEVGGRPHPNIGYLCEYHADPVTGHSHGHNLVTVVCLSAAIGLQRVIKFSKEPLGKITVIGCSYNARGTAKTKMMQAGFFRGIDFLLTAYPAPFTCLQPRFLASKKLRVTFRGRKAGEDDQPWEEANPVNAAVITHQSLVSLRQHLMPDWQLKGVIPCAGTDPCIMPDMATAEYQIKAPTERGLKVLSEKLNHCFEGAAMATGCRFEQEKIGPTFISNVNCPSFEELYASNATLNGFTFHTRVRRSMDEDEIGAISQTVATMKVFYYAGTSFKLGSDEFARFTGCPDAEFMSIVQGKTLAMTGLDLCTKGHLMAVVYDDHQKVLTKNIQEAKDPV